MATKTVKKVLKIRKPRPFPLQGMRRRGKYLMFYPDNCRPIRIVFDSWEVLARSDAWHVGVVEIIWWKRTGGALYAQWRRMGSHTALTVKMWPTLDGLVTELVQPYPQLVPPSLAALIKQLPSREF